METSRSIVFWIPFLVAVNVTYHGARPWHEGAEGVVFWIAFLVVANVTYHAARP
jgi:hypothetical protein